MSYRSLATLVGKTKESTCLHDASHQGACVITFLEAIGDEVVEDDTQYGIFSKPTVLLEL